MAEAAGGRYGRGGRHALRDGVHDGIITATHHGCDLIFMASHGRRGIGALLLGSETQKVLTHSRSRCWAPADPARPP